MLTDLVLEGGGVKGIALVGAVSALYTAGYRFAQVAGTSAGSIVGAAIAAGMTPDEMVTVLMETDLSAFMDSGRPLLPFVGTGIGLVLENGLFRGDAFRRWVDDVMASRGVRTFADLRMEGDLAEGLAPHRRYRLVVMAADVTKRRLVRFPWDYEAMYGLDPDTASVADAVRASMSIPFFFSPVRLKYPGPPAGSSTSRRDAEDDPDEDSVTLGPPTVRVAGPVQAPKPNESVLVDGGILSNFPIAAFDRTDGRPPRWPTIGVRLSGEAGSRDLMPPVGIGPVGLGLDVIATLLDHHDNTYAQQPEVRKRTITVDTSGSSMIDFRMSRQDQMKLYHRGRQAAEKFLETWSFP